MSDVVEGEENRWFWEKAQLRLKDDGKTLFWDSVWSGEKTLKELFPRLYNLCTNKDGTVKDMGKWSSGSWTWRVGWRRELLKRERGREKDLMNILSDFSPKKARPIGGRREQAGVIRSR